MPLPVRLSQLKVADPVKVSGFPPRTGDERDLGYAPASDGFQVSRFPEEAQSLIASSEDLYFRLQRFSQKMHRDEAPMPETLAMIDRLRASF